MMGLIILVPSLPNLLNCSELHRRRAWHDAAFTYVPLCTESLAPPPLTSIMASWPTSKHRYKWSSAEPVVEADYKLYNQVHFNGTLQRKFVNYDCFTSKARIEKLVALQNDGTVRQPSDPQTPLWTIVDGAGTDGSDIMRMLEVG